MTSTRPARSRRKRNLSPLLLLSALLAAAALALPAEASLPRADANTANTAALAGAEAVDSSPLIAAGLEKPFSLPVGDELEKAQTCHPAPSLESLSSAEGAPLEPPQLASRACATSFSLHLEPVDFGLNPQRGPPLEIPDLHQGWSVADPKTRIGGFRLDPEDFIGGERSLSLGLHRGYLVGRPGFTEDEPPDPWGLCAFGLPCPKPIQKLLDRAADATVETTQKSIVSVNKAYSDSVRAVGGAYRQMGEEAIWFAGTTLGTLQHAHKVRHDPNASPKEKKQASVAEGKVMLGLLATIEGVRAPQSMRPAGRGASGAGLVSRTASNDTFVFRGTSAGYEGSPSLQRIGLSPASTDPVVATAFATESERFGDGVLHLASRTRLERAGIEFSEGNVLSSLEAEVAVGMPPARFAESADLTITAGRAREILSEMGHSLPPHIGSKADLSMVLRNSSRMSPAEIEEFVRRARASGRK